jgi:formate dehydrogenase (coenzyme F420) beta subunit
MYAVLKTDGNPQAAIRSMLGDMLSAKLVDAVLVAARTPYSALPMPTLCSDPAKLETADPLAPVAPFNAARQAASILQHDAGRRVAVVLRPCEVRALIELAKLHQCTLGNSILIGIECLGRMENDVYLETLKGVPNLVAEFYQSDGYQDRLTSACQACIAFQPSAVDVTLCLFGYDPADSIGLNALTDKGRSLLHALGMSPTQPPESREAVYKALLERRRQGRAALLHDVESQTDNIRKLQEYFATCLNCYNCRVACPVCYCKECVFATDVFAHPPEVLLRRATKRGAVKLPADTTMFHLTRMAHMSHACVACGHCTSVCPSHIAVADIFIKVAVETQALYHYEAGRDVDEPIPLLVFEKESEAKAGQG